MRGTSPEPITRCIVEASLGETFFCLRNMACLLLPCDCEEWWEDKKFFLLLMHLHSLDEFLQLIKAHSRRAGGEDWGFSRRLRDLEGLRAFLVDYCSPEEQQTFFNRTLPFIAKSASCLDERVPETGIPFLERHEAASLVLGRKLVVSLLANAFLCTFPPVYSDSKGERPPFNFDRFFAIFLEDDESRRKTQAAKLKCILCYFSQVAGRDLQGTITLQRQVIPQNELPLMPEWVGCGFPLCQVVVNNSVGIEDAGSHTLQVNFANRYIGGMTLGSGRVQEEIRFCICPELIISMLIMGPMDNNEAVIVTGVERFANYKGYGASLEFAGECRDPAERDVFGNLLTSLVAIDALSFTGKLKPVDQYKDMHLIRELNKAYVGFQCQQDRGDISTNLLAYSVKRPSIAFVEENYPDFEPSVNTRVEGALGNVNLSTKDLQIPKIANPVKEGVSPLSPIREMSESPRFTSNEGPGSSFPVLTSGSGGHQATGGKGESGGEQTVDQFASNLTNSLFGSLTAPKAAKDTRSKPVSQVPKVNLPVSPLATKVTASVPTLNQSGEQDNLDNLATSLADSILKSSLKKGLQLGTDEPDAAPPNSTFPPPTPPQSSPTVETTAEELAKSIVSDILSTTKAPSSPTVPTQTVGQSSSSARVGMTHFASQLAHSIISSAITSQPPPPKILIQADRIGSVSAESPLSSRSSSLTGQSLTLHEYTDDLVESTVMDVLATQMVADPSPPPQEEEEETLLRQSVTPPTSISCEAEQLADDIVTLSIRDVVQQQRQECERGSPTPPEIASTKIKKLEGSSSPQGKRHKALNLRSKHRRSSIGSEHSEVASSDGEYQPSSLSSLNPHLLSTPSSRKSYAWSVASTRDEDSRPVSPTDMDRIALSLASNMEEFTNLCSEMIIRDALADIELGLGGEKVMSPLTLDSDFESSLQIEPTKGHMKVDKFLSTLDNVELESVHSVEDEVDAMEAYSARWHKMRRVLLRPVATGNWGCGVFGGDPQLKAMIQWAAVSAAGRPKMMYFPFNDKRVNQLPEVTKKLYEQCWTVGRLWQALRSYSQRGKQAREKQDLFTALLAT